MFLARLGFWNLMRNKLRTLLSVVVIASGVFTLISGQGMIGGLSLNIIMTQIQTVSGHVALQPEDYPKEPLSHPVDNLITIDADAEQWLDTNTVAWTKRIQFAPEAIFGGDGLRVKAIGFTDKDETVFNRDDWDIREGGKMPATAEDGVLVATGPADLLGLKAGDDLTLKVRTHKGALNAMSVKVAGVFSGGSPIVDSQVVMVPWDLAQTLVRNGDKTSHVNILLSDRFDMNDVGQQLTGYPLPIADLDDPKRVSEAVVNDAGFVTWESETRALIDIQQIRQNALNFITFILLMVAGFGIANTILMAAYERIREVGTLRAMGMTRDKVLTMFVIEGAMLGVVGGVLGVLAGDAMVWNYATYGLDLTEAIKESGEANNNMPFKPIIYFDFDPSMLALGFAFAVVMAIVASIYPAIVASRMVPADAVRA